MSKMKNLVASTTVIHGVKPIYGVYIGTMSKIYTNLILYIIFSRKF